MDITPEIAIVRAGDKVSYTATAMDVQGNTWDVTGLTTFGVDDPQGSMTTKHLYRWQGWDMDGAGDIHD